MLLTSQLLMNKYLHSNDLYRGFYQCWEDESHFDPLILKIVSQVIGSE